VATQREVEELKSLLFHAGLALDSALRRATWPQCRNEDGVCVVCKEVEGVKKHCTSVHAWIEEKLNQTCDYTKTNARKV
jgi:hypothetical protein